MRFTGELLDVRIYTAALHDNEIMALAPLDSVTGIARLQEGQRTAPQQAKLSNYFLEVAAPPDLETIWSTAFELREELSAFKESLPTVMVMQELSNRPDTHLLIRGAYDHPGEKVPRGLPAALPPMPATAPLNRLGFAQWLTSPQHPLTSRVAVNRLWQMLFGTGIVKTGDITVAGVPPEA